MDENDRHMHAEVEAEPAPTSGMSGQTSGTPGAGGTSGKNPSGGTNYIDWAGEVETTLKAMLGFPAQVLGAVLPDESIRHFKAAGRETMLAVYSLWRNIDSATQGPPQEKVRNHIEVE
ncbi:MAG: hypothetical protein WCD37_00320 [Chloroflexia bacterium]